MLKDLDLIRIKLICCLFFSLQLADDRMALVSGISLDPEAAIGVTKRLPPKWVDGADEVSAVLWHIQHTAGLPTEGFISVVTYILSVV